MLNKINVYWWNGTPNAGDYYSKWLASKMFGQTTFLHSKEPDFVCCGSILSHAGLRYDTKVCGAGFHNEDGKVVIDNVDNYYAIRGKLSYKKLNTEKQIVLGDSGLLASKFYKPQSKHKHRYGIVCHWKDYQALKNIYGSKHNIINMGTNNVEEVLKKISECEMVFSTSLHGIIFAHSFGIPAKHVEYQKLESKNNFKFKDYYSVLDIPYEKYVLKSKDDLRELIRMVDNKEKYLPSKEVIEDIQENLLGAFKKLIKTVKEEKERVKAVICTIAKNENYYINNWVRYHLDLGFKKIYLFDNNETTTQYVGDFLDKDIKDSVEIIDKRGIHRQALQLDCYNEFYKEHGKTFDWCAFIDADEFVSGVKDVSLWLADSKYDRFDMIRLKWNLYGDDGVIERDLSIPVQDFFKKIINNKAISNQGKAIIRGNLSDINIGSCHYAFRGKNYVDGVITDKTKISILNQCLPSGLVSYSKITIKENYSKEKIFLNHYMTKTLSEFAFQKYNRGDAIFENRSIDFSYFWRINTQTKEKLDYINNVISNKITIQKPKIKDVSNVIDIVVPYVDSSDGEWQALFNYYSPKIISDGSNGKIRFRKNDLFKYWFRSVETYTPWINNIFLLVQNINQVPNWISHLPNINIITHEMFIPTEYLPVFNSQAIEMFLHKIPGLSEKFIYANDDTYFIGPLNPENFFIGNSIKVDFKELPLGDSVPIWKSSIMNSGLLVNQDETETLKNNGRYITPMHVARPYLKSKLEEVHKLYGPEIASSISKFREAQNYTVYIYDFYMKKMGLTLTQDYEYKHFSNKSPVGLIGNFMDNPSTNKSICINDSLEIENPQWDKRVLELFDNKFPKKSRYEL